MSFIAFIILHLLLLGFGEPIHEGMEANENKNNSVLMSREYKVMLNPVMFDDGGKSISHFGDELSDCLNMFVKRKAKPRSFQLKENHEIVFLDTKEFAIDASRLLLRERTILGAKKKVELTLKCRSPDYFVSLGANLQTAEGVKNKSKLEEDISAPFTSKFSRSSTIVLKGSTPTSFKEAADYFPILSELSKSSETKKLEAVNGLRMQESVLIGPEITVLSTSAKFALILWKRKAKGRIVAVELSFRYELMDGQVDRPTALAFIELFDGLQQLDWCSSSSLNKTAYLYGALRNTS